MSTIPQQSFLPRVIIADFDSKLPYFASPVPPHPPKSPCISFFYSFP